MNTDTVAHDGATLKVCVREGSGDANVRIRAHVRIFRIERLAATHAPGQTDTQLPKRAGRTTSEQAAPARTQAGADHTREDGCVEFNHLQPGVYSACASVGEYEVCSQEHEYVDLQAGGCDALTLTMHTGFKGETLVVNDQCALLPCTNLQAGKSFILRVSHRRSLGRLALNIDPGSAHLQGEPRELVTEGEADGHGGVGGGGNKMTLRQMEYLANYFKPGTNAMRISGEAPDGTSIMYRMENASHEHVQRVGGDISVTLRRTSAEPTEDLPLWVVIRNSTNALCYNNYDAFMNHLLCGAPDLRRQAIVEAPRLVHNFHQLAKRRYLPYTDADAYRVLKIATEAFVMVNCGVLLEEFPFTEEDREYMLRKVGLTPDLPRFWQNYLQQVNGTQDHILPYLALVREKLKDVSIKTRLFDDPDRLPPAQYQDCTGILRSKLAAPCMMELIWSYWHEEGMLVQTLNAVTRRFQNVRVSGSRLDPLANFEVDPLRPLNNLLWAFVQDEQHRLSVVRRNYEYNHEYGLRLEGRAVGDMQAADARSKFLEAFHNLLYCTIQFYRQDDNTTIVADGFPVLNALKEVHLILAEGAHNQFGDLPSTSRIEMLMQQWLLARPEFREFLPTRVMVAYPEPWMDRVDAMKRMQGWNDTNVLNFRNLGVFGEQLLLTIRYGNWADVHDAAQGANWARFWRPEVQGYVHAYRAVSGVELSAADNNARVNATLPSTLLRQRLAQQRVV
jgi:hypothetical protein